MAVSVFLAFFPLLHGFGRGTMIVSLCGHNQMSASVSAKLYDLVAPKNLYRFDLVVFPPQQSTTPLTTILLLSLIIALFATSRETLSVIVEVFHSISFHLANPYIYLFIH